MTGHTRHAQCPVDLHDATTGSGWVGVRRGAAWTSCANSLSHACQDPMVLDGLHTSNILAVTLWMDEELAFTGSGATPPPPPKPLPPPLSYTQQPGSSGAPSCCPGGCG